MNELQIVYTPLSEILRWPRNPRRHAEKELSASIARFGFADPVTIDETTGHLVEGHGRINALESRKANGDPPPERIHVGEDGEWLVPVVRGVRFENEQEAEAYLLAHNRITEIGDYDKTLLAEVLEAARPNLEGIGWSPLDVDIILRAQTPVEIPTVKERLEVFEAGEIKQIVLYFEGKDYDGIVQRLETAAAALGTEDNTNTFLQLLEHYENSTSEAD